MFSSPDIYLGCRRTFISQRVAHLASSLASSCERPTGCYTSVCAGAVSITGSCKGHCRHCCSSCSKQLTERVRVCTVRVLHILFILHRNKSLNLTLSLTVVLCQRMCVTVVKRWLTGCHDSRGQLLQMFLSDNEFNLIQEAAPPPHNTFSLSSLSPLHPRLSLIT